LRIADGQSQIDAQSSAAVSGLSVLSGDANINALATLAGTATRIQHGTSAISTVSSATVIGTILWIDNDPSGNQWSNAGTASGSWTDTEENTNTWSDRPSSSNTWANEATNENYWEAA
jgi:hypothetical protein